MMYTIYSYFTKVLLVLVFTYKSPARPYTSENWRPSRPNLPMRIVDTTHRMATTGERDNTQHEKLSSKMPYCKGFTPADNGIDDQWLFSVSHTHKVGPQRHRLCGETQTASLHIDWCCVCVCGTDQSQYPDKLEDDSEVEHDGNGCASTLCSVWSVTGKHSHQQHHLHTTHSFTLTECIDTTVHSAILVVKPCILLMCCGSALIES